MPVVASVDYPGKRIYLSADTASAEQVDTLDVYKELRALRRTTDAHQQFRPLIEAFGNEAKIVGLTFTPIYVRLASGVRIVPFDTPHRLKVVRDTFAVDGVAGRDCFDRASVVSNVDIDVDFPEIEVRVAGGSLTDSSIAAAVRAELATELARVSELHLIHGLLSGSPLSVTETSRAAGAVSQSIGESGGTVTVTRV